MKNKKYVMCSGLAFADVEDMEVLHQYALEGWIFRDFKYLCYVLYKEEPQDLIYSYDIQKIKKDEQKDYYMMFEEAGWDLVVSKDEVHFFRAKPDTISLHTEHKTRNEQFKSALYISIVLLMIGAFFLCVALFTDITENWFSGIAGALIGGGGVLFIGSLLRVKGKRWKLIVSFRRATWMAFLGLGCFVLGNYLLPESIFTDLLEVFGIFIGIFGAMYMCFQYRVYKDHKEPGGKRK